MPVTALSTLSDYGVSQDTIAKAIKELNLDGIGDDDKRVLAAFLFQVESGNDPDINSYGLPAHSDKTVEGDGCEYLVLTEAEVDEVIAERIADDLWAFNADFLANMTEIDSKVFVVLAEQCEGANDAIRSLIDKTCGLDDFVEQAVAYDGRGHFLSGYDGCENEVRLGDETYYLYRQN